MPKALLELNLCQANKIIEAEFNKSTNDIDEYVKIIQEWIKTQPHFPEEPEPNVIRTFLLLNKLSIEKCKQKIDLYYSIRNVMPEILNKHPCSPEMIEQAKITPVIPLPKLAPDKRRIIVSKISGDYGPDAFVHERYVAHIFNVFELLIREEVYIGTHFIHDCSSFKLGHVTKISPIVFKKASILAEKVFSNRVASIHLVNYHPALDTTLNLFIRLFPQKLKERIKIHKTTDALYDIFPKEILPKDFGGEEDSIADLTELLLEKFKENKELFDKLGSIKVNEALRPSKLVNDELLGFYGNFRKIDVD